MEKYAKSGGSLYSQYELEYMFRGSYHELHFESWEIRLMIHNKKQRIKALKAQLERL